jgi:hypothetical protein
LAQLIPLAPRLHFGEVQRKEDANMASRFKAVPKALLALFFTFGVLDARSEAVPTLSFDDVTTQGGTVTYAGGAAPAVGTGILFDTLDAITTPLNPGQYSCASCVLNFTTGPETSPGVLPYEWGAGGSFTLMGSVPAAGAAGTLLTGTFTGASATAGTSSITLSGVGLDFKHPALIAFFGLDAIVFEASSTNIQAGTTVFPSGPGGAFSGTITNADLDNIETDIPEPGSALLLLLGIGSLAAYRRRA